MIEGFLTVRPLMMVRAARWEEILAAPLPEEGGTAATVTYGIVMIAISAGFVGVWVYVVTHARSLGAALPPSALRRSVPGFTLGGAAYAAGTLIAAFWSPVAALIIFGLLAVYYLFEHLPGPAGDIEDGEPAAG